MVFAAYQRLTVRQKTEAYGRHGQEEDRLCMREDTTNSGNPNHVRFRFSGTITNYLEPNPNKQAN